MPDDFFIINLIVKDGETLVKNDDLPGADWLVLTGSFDAQSDIRLSWATEFGTTYQSSGMYFVKDEGGFFVGSRLIVNALVENARGSDGEDFIQGNEVGNIIYGDGFVDTIGDDDILWGAAGDDTIYGGAGQDEVSGDEGDDILYGDLGNDTITGNAGIDRIEGGAGQDEMYGGADAGDVVAYLTSDAAVTIKITFGSATTGRGGHAEGDTIGGFTNVIGSAFDDVITDTVKGTIAFGYNDNTFYGYDGDDTLRLGGGNDAGFGNDGDDEIFGERGRDELNGGKGADYLDGGSDNDRLLGLVGNDVLLGRGGNDRLYGGADDDRLLGGGGADILVGSSGDDLLRGEDGNDRLVGGGGADRLIGGVGADRMAGGGGADTFIFNAASDSGRGLSRMDTILDFTGKADTLDLAGIDANPATARDDAFTDMGYLPFSGSAGELRLTDINDGIRVDLDLDGDRRADLQIFLTDLNLLRDGDVIL